MAVVCGQPHVATLGKRRRNAQAACLTSAVALEQFGDTYDGGARSGSKRLRILELPDTAGNALYGHELPYDVLYLLPSTIGEGAAGEIKELLRQIDESRGLHLNKRIVPIDESKPALWELWTSFRLGATENLYTEKGVEDRAAISDEDLRRAAEVLYDMYLSASGSACPTPTSSPVKKAPRRKSRGCQGSKRTID